MARLGGGEVVPLPGVDIPGLFHGQSATPPVSQQPLADETPDGRRDGTGWVDRPPAAAGAHAMTAAPPGLDTSGNRGSVPPPPVPALPGLEPLPEAQRRALGQNAPFPANPDAERGSVVSTPTPDRPLMPPHTGGAPPVVPPMTVLESQADPGLTQPTGPINGMPTGPRSRVRVERRPGASRVASKQRKVQVNSENQVGAATAAAGYRTIQNPTEGANPALTPERMKAEGLRAGADPDLLLEDRIWDTYTPEKDSAESVRAGIQRKITNEQTHRVLVDMRGLRTRVAAVRDAIKAIPLQGVKEVMFYTEDGLSAPFRP